MKPTILATAFAAFAAVTAVASAQTPASDLVASVPFAFHSGPKLMDAGRYFIRPNSPSPSMVTVRDARDASKSMMGIVTLQTASANNARADKGKLVFHRYGEAWFLREVQAPGSKVAYVMPKSKREREYARGNSGRLAEVAVVAFDRNAAAAAE